MATLEKRLCRFCLENGHEVEMLKCEGGLIPSMECDYCPCCDRPNEIPGIHALHPRLEDDGLPKEEPYDQDKEEPDAA